MCDETPPMEEDIEETTDIAETVAALKTATDDIIQQSQASQALIQEFYDYIMDSDKRKEAYHVPNYYD